MDTDYQNTKTKKKKKELINALAQVTSFIWVQEFYPFLIQTGVHLIFVFLVEYIRIKECDCLQHHWHKNRNDPVVESTAQAPEPFQNLPVSIHNLFLYP